MRRVAIGTSMVNLRTQNTESEIETHVSFGKGQKKYFNRFSLWSYMLYEKGGERQREKEKHNDINNVTDIIVVSSNSEITS